jgi:transposase
MEACGGAHFWGREIGKLGHEVRLIPPAYVKPFVKRQKNDAADAEAICEAAQRPTMRFVPVKSEETQGRPWSSGSGNLLIRQRTQAINALRGHLTEFGQVVPQGRGQRPPLIAIVEDPEAACPLEAVATLRGADRHPWPSRGTDRQGSMPRSAHRAKEDEVARRLMTVPGIGPLIATAIAVLAPPPETFRKGRDFAAWLGLVPRQHSTGGKQRLGATTKMGERSALLHNSRLRHDSPFPRWLSGHANDLGGAEGEKRFIRATRIWISAVWRSGSLAAMRSPKALRQRIFASIRLRAWYPVQRFQNARP